MLLKAGQEGACSAITCTRSARRRTPKIELGMMLLSRRATCRSTFAGRSSSAQADAPTLDIPAGTVARIDGYTVMHKPARSSRSSRTCTSAASVSASS